MQTRRFQETSWKLPEPARICKSAAKYIILYVHDSDEWGPSFVCIETYYMKLMYYMKLIYYMKLMRQYNFGKSSSLGCSLTAT